MIIECILLGAEAPHRNHEISDGALELLPILVVIEHLER